MPVASQLSEFACVLDLLDAMKLRIDALEIEDEESEAVSGGLCAIHDAFLKRLSAVPAATAEEVLLKVKQLGRLQRDENEGICIAPIYEVVVSGMVADVERLGALKK